MKTNNNKPRFTEVCQLDICTSDYFSGYSYPVINVEMYNGITTHDIAEQVKDEINMTWDYLVNESDNSFTEEEIKLFESFCEELKSKPAEIIKGDFGDASDEDSEPCFMYLSLCKPVVRYGMVFLNE